MWLCCEGFVAFVCFAFLSCYDSFFIVSLTFFFVYSILACTHSFFLFSSVLFPHLLYCVPHTLPSLKLFISYFFFSLSLILSPLPSLLLLSCSSLWLPLSAPRPSIPSPWMALCVHVYSEEEAKDK